MNRNVWLIGAVGTGKTWFQVGAPFPEGVSCTRLPDGTVIEFDPLGSRRWPTPKRGQR